MSKLLQQKNSGILKGSLKDFDDKSRRVKSVFSKMDCLDSDGDVIDSRAYDKTIKQWGPQGLNRIWHLTDHQANLSNAIAKFSEINVVGDELQMLTDFPNTTKANDLYELYKHDDVNEHSVGFVAIDKETKSDSTFGNYTLIKEIQLHEGSSVLWGANPLTPNISVGKSYKGFTQTEKLNIFKSLTDQLLGFTKALRKGKMSDDGFILLEISIKQVQSQIEILSQELLEQTIPLAGEVAGPVNKNDDEAIYQQLLLIDLKLKACK